MFDTCTCKIICFLTGSLHSCQNWNQPYLHVVGATGQTDCTDKTQLGQSCWNCTRAGIQLMISYPLSFWWLDADTHRNAHMPDTHTHTPATAKVLLYVWYSFRPSSGERVWNLPLLPHPPAHSRLPTSNPHSTIVVSMCGCEVSAVVLCICVYCGAHSVLWMVLRQPLLTDAPPSTEWC